MKWISHPERRRGEVFFGNFAQQDVVKFSAELQANLRRGIVARFVDSERCESLEVIPYSNYYAFYPYFAKYKYLIDNSIELDVPYFYQIHRDLL